LANETTFDNADLHSVTSSSIHYDGEKYRRSKDLLGIFDRNTFKGLKGDTKNVPPRSSPSAGIASHLQPAYQQRRGPYARGVQQGMNSIPIASLRSGQSAPNELDRKNSMSSLLSLASELDKSQREAAYNMSESDAGERESPQHLPALEKPEYKSIRSTLRARIEAKRSTQSNDSDSEYLNELLGIEDVGLEKDNDGEGVTPRVKYYNSPNRTSQNRVRVGGGDGINPSNSLRRVPSSGMPGGVDAGLSSPDQLVQARHRSESGESSAVRALNQPVSPHPYRDGLLGTASNHGTESAVTVDQEKVERSSGGDTHAYPSTPASMSDKPAAGDISKNISVLRAEIDTMEQNMSYFFAWPPRKKSGTESKVGVSELSAYAKEREELSGKQKESCEDAVTVLTDFSGSKGRFCRFPRHSLEGSDHTDRDAGDTDDNDSCASPQLKFDECNTCRSCGNSKGQTRQSFSRCTQRKFSDSFSRCLLCPLCLEAISATRTENSKIRLTNSRPPLPSPLRFIPSNRREQSCTRTQESYIIKYDDLTLSSTIIEVATSDSLGSPQSQRSNGNASATKEKHSRIAFARAVPIPNPKSVEPDRPTSSEMLESRMNDKVTESVVDCSSESEVSQANASESGGKDATLLRSAPVSVSSLSPRTASRTTHVLVSPPCPSQTPPTHIQPTLPTPPGPGLAEALRRDNPTRSFVSYYGPVTPTFTPTFSSPDSPNTCGSTACCDSSKKGWAPDALNSSPDECDASMSMSEPFAMLRSQCESQSPTQASESYQRLASPAAPKGEMFGKLHGSCNGCDRFGTEGESAARSSVANEEARNDGNELLSTLRPAEPESRTRMIRSYDLNNVREGLLTVSQLMKRLLDSHPQ
jgi:hypothetical protein